MSCFYGDPSGIHLGKCQNFIPDDSGGHYCLAPTIGIGREYPTDRDICATCRARTLQTGDRIAKRYGHAIATGGHVDEWLEANTQILMDLDRTVCRLNRDGAPMSDVVEVKRRRTMYERCREAVLSAIAAG